MTRLFLVCLAVLLLVINFSVAQGSEYFKGYDSREEMVQDCIDEVEAQHYEPDMLPEYEMEYQDMIQECSYEV